LGDPNNIGAISSEIFNGQLYWGVMNSVTGGQLWRTDGITTSAVITDGFGNPENWVISSLAVFGDALYAGVINNPVVQDEEVQVWRSADGVRWEQVVNGFGIPRYGAVNGLEEINGLLYLMVENDLTGLEVWRTGNGMDWVQVGFDGFGDVNNQWSYWDNAMVVFKEKLYIGTNNYVTGGEVWQMTPETVPPAVVTLNGASEGFAGQTYQFTATVEPISTSLPLTYTWQASGQAPVIHTGGLMDTASFTWEAPGTQGITVTASNQGGEVIGNHTIEISRMTFRIFMPIALRACLPIYSDNFSDPASGWPVGESSETTYAYLNGEYQVLIKPAGVTHGAIIDLGVSDFQFELDARGVSNLDGSVGLIFNWTDANQYYLFEVSDGWFSLWLRDPQNWTPLIHWTYNSAIHPGLEWNHLEVVRAGSSITLFANDQNLGKVNDSTYFGTWLGLASASYTLPNFDSRYDNFVVYSGCTGSHAASACISPTLSMTDVWMVDGSGKPGR
jgi:hypothetical protein